MKRVLRPVGTIAFLLAMYYLLQLVFLTVTSAVAVKVGLLTGTSPPEAANMVGDAQFLNDNPHIQALMVNARACGIFLSALSLITISQTDLRV